MAFEPRLSVNVKYACYFLMWAISTSSFAGEEPALRLLDAALSQHLKDPSSAQQYSVGSVRTCDGLTAHPMGAYAPGGCLCYALNAKNSYGGYVGIKYGVATISDGNVSIRDERELAFDFEVTCKASGMKKRDPAKLK